jgi:serine/threonine-protein kinase
MTASERLLGGRYEVGELLGYGGMAEVHRGRDLRLGRDVAIKMLRTDLARDHTFQMRFRREAQNSAVLNHPGIAAVYDTGEEHAVTGEALPYIVMEFVNGRTLKDVLAAEGRLQPRRALEITADICAALEFSHRHGIIHRDVKPGNAMLTANGQVKVMDFGIARDLASGATTMTQTSAVIGTAQYLSPEQARGEAVDARSDVYATGCVLFELLCGHPPFVGDSPVSVAYQHVREDPRAPSELNPEVSPDVDAVVLKALAKNPANRYQSAAEMRADLLRAAAGRPVLATPVLNNAETALLGPAGEPARVGDSDRRKASTWVLVALGALGVLAVVALIVGLILSNRAQEDLVAVPSLFESTEQEAIAQLEALDLVPERGDDVQSAECAVGRVTEQSPAPGEEVAVNSTVTYRLCGGPELVTIPDVVGSTEQAARTQLEGLGLTVQVEAENSSAPEGTVVRTEPGAGREVSVESTVTIFVSRANISAVPDVVDETRANAEAILRAGGFEPNVVNGDVAESPDQVGTVQSQNPGAGTELEEGQSVTISIYVDDADLAVTVSGPNAGVVIVQWDNGIYGGISINWGDESPPEDFNQSEGERQHQYEVPGPGEEPLTFTITVSDPNHDRSFSQDVTIPPA